jgi:hypothetical protein
VALTVSASTWYCCGPAVLSRASEPMPMPIGTLDAISLGDRDDGVVEEHR